MLTASLRSQVNPDNKDEFKDVSPERQALDLIPPRFQPIYVWYLQSICGLCSRFDSPPFLCIQLPGLNTV